MNDVTLIAILVPVIIALVAMTAKAGLNVERYGGLLSLACGLGLTALAYRSGAVAPPFTSFDVMLTGLVAGLSASGFYSGGRALAGK